MKRKAPISLLSFPSTINDTIFSSRSVNDIFIPEILTFFFEL